MMEANTLLITVWFTPGNRLEWYEHRVFMIFSSTWLLHIHIIKNYSMLFLALSLIHI